MSATQSPDPAKGSQTAPNAAVAGSGQASNTKKAMTKAERRDLQEKQRAAKAAATASKAPPKEKPTKNTQQPPTTPVASTSALSAKKIGHKADPVVPVMDIEAQRRHQSRIFAHFALAKKESGLGAGIKGEIHPAILRLGRQFADMKIVGANARCIAMLTAFKIVIQDYVTPSHATLSRDLTSHLSPQISYLVSARPMAVSMGNAIRELKYDITVGCDDLPEQDAKNYLYNQIDTYISHRIILAGNVIEEHAIPKIKDGDVIMTFARSSVVERTLLAAWNSGKKFWVKVVDSRPLLEGKQLLAVLLKAGIPCTYLLVNSVASVIPEVSMVFVGAHAINSNGSVYSRAGTALVAMLAKEQSVPVLVLCETYKYSNNLQLDSFTKNELAPAPDPITSFPKITPREKLVLGTDMSKESPNLQVISPLYDLTPYTHITVLVTEVGLIPPSAISTLSGLRESDKEKFRLQMAM